MKHQWLTFMSVLSQNMPWLYAGIVWFLLGVGYTFLLIFPALVLFCLISLSYIISSTPLSTWQPVDWLIAAALLMTSIISLWQSIIIFKTSIQSPAGKLLLSDDFPALIDTIDELAKTYNTHDIDQIKLTTRFKIEIIRTPTYAFPSKFTTSLLIGLPIMSCTSPLHLKLLLARCIGHLGKSKKQMNRHILYLRHLWKQYAEYFNKNNNVHTFLLNLFFRWYSPVFSFTTIPAVKEETLFSDNLLLEITTLNNVAEVIIFNEIKRSYINNEFWPNLFETAYKYPKPEYLPYGKMNDIITENITQENIQDYFNTAIIINDDIYSEQPALSMRLANIEYNDFILPKKSTETAATYFFGDRLIEIQKNMDNVWYLKIKSYWEKRYRKGLDEKKTLKTFRRQASKALLSNDEAKKYLLLIEKYLETKLALPLYREIIRTNSLDPMVCFEVGRLLLKSNDDEGINALKIAMSLKPDITEAACQHIVRYAIRAGDMKQAQIYRRLIISHHVDS